MDVQVNPKSTVKAQVVVKLVDENLQKQFQTKVNHYAKTLDLKGFRKGKIPVSFIQRKYTKAIKAEMAGDLINNSIQEALKASKLDVIGGLERVKVDSEPDFNLNEVFEYKIDVENYPEIKQLQLDQFALDTITAEPDQTSIDETLLQIQQKHADWQDSDAEAQVGDKVTYQMQQQRADGSEQPADSERDHILTASEDDKKDDEAYVQVINQALLGCKTGDSVPFSLAEKDETKTDEEAVKSTLKITAVKKAELPALDEAFIKRISNDQNETLEQLIDEIKKNFKQQIETITASDAYEQLVLFLCRQHDVELPEMLLDDELKQRQNRPQNKENELTPETNVKQHILFRAFRNEAKIEISEAEIDQIIDHQIALRGMQDYAQQAREFYYKNPGYLNTLVHDRLVEKVYAYCQQNYTINETKLDSEEALMEQFQLRSKERAIELNQSASAEDSKEAAENT